MAKKTVHLDETLPAREDVRKADFPSPALDEKPLKRYMVQLKHLPQRMLWAADADGAWLAYKRLLGIIASDHKPRIVEVK